MPQNISKYVQLKLSHRLNLINGKQYVGDYSTNNLNDSYLGSGRSCFMNALKKYKRFNFKREILEFFDTKKDAFNAQEKYILYYKTHISQGGYNISWKGGHNAKGTGPWLNKHLSEQHKQNISNSLKGKVTWNKGLSTPQEIKDKISKSEKGKITPEETKQKMSLASKGKPKSKEHAEKCGLANLGKKRPKIFCEHCQKEYADFMYKLYHGEKCKYIK